MELDLEETVAGVVLPVQAQPGARKNGITGVHAGRLKVAVTQAPEKGKANQALAKLLAELLDLKKADVALLSGDTNSHKKFLLTGMTADELRARLRALIPDA